MAWAQRFGTVCIGAFTLAGCDSGAAAVGRTRPFNGAIADAGAAPSGSPVASTGDAGQTAGTEPRVRLPTEPWQSGRRLRARVLTDGQGAVQFLSWHDTLYDTDCAFSLTATDGWRCLPTAYWPEIRYADRQCQDPVVIVSRETTVPHALAATPRYPADYAQREASPRCAPERPSGIEWTIYHIWGGREETVWYQLTGDKCGPVDPAELMAPGAYPRAVEELAMDDFVGAQLTEDGTSAGAEALRARWLVADDGSYEVQSLMDATDEQCDVLDVGDEAAACVPVRRRVATQDVYLSSDCSEPALHALRSTGGAGCSAPRVVVEPASDCVAGQRPLRLHGVETLREAYVWSSQGTGDECVLVDNPAFETFLSAAAPALPDAALTERGTGRLRAFFGTSFSGVPARNAEAVPPLRVASPFFDTERAHPCVAAQTENGQRCLPPYPALDGPRYFLDAACLEPAVLVERDDCYGAEGGAYWEVTVAGSDEAVVRAVVVASTSRTANPFYTNQTQTTGGVTGECRLADERLQGSYVAAAAERLDPADFPELNERLE